MSEIRLTDREREYLDCEIPLLTGGRAVGHVTLGVLASMAQALFMPSASYSKADRGLMRTIRELYYTKYKKAVLRKQSGTPKKNDAKLLKKLNEKDFIFAAEAYDPDEFTKQVYEEYMKNHLDNG